MKYPTAQKVAATSASSLSKIAFLCEEKASAIHAAAKQSTASIHGPSAELIVSQLANEGTQTKDRQCFVDQRLFLGYDLARWDD